MNSADAHAPPAQSASPSATGDRLQKVGGWRSLQWWPSLAGAAFAVFVALDLFSGEEDGRDLAAVVAASGLVYLAAASLQRPWIAWPVFFASVLVITTARLGWIGFDATWVLFAAAGLFIAYGILSPVRQPFPGLPLQSLAMAGFGAVAAVALYINQVAGAYLVAAGLLAHAGWDAYHHWENRVVIRSMAEFCFVLDTLLAIAIVLATVWR